MIKDCIRKLVERKSLRYDEAREAMKEIMSGAATASQIAAFVTALRMKGETTDEIAALSTTMKEFGHRIRPRVQGRLVDTCGTGGDRIKTFNISTTAAFAVAGAGIAVAKHGNRSFTSKSGSADVLERLGVNLHVEAAVVERCIEEVGIGFMFAPAFHPAMKYAVEPRRDIGVRTVFNVLGPLANPADADSQLIGVYSEALVASLAPVLQRLGCEEAMVVHGLDGLDEVSTIGGTVLAWLRDDEIHTLQTTPQDLGVRRARPEDILGGTPAENAEVSFQILRGKDDVQRAKRDIVLVNAAAGIIVGGKADDFEEGLELARDSIDSGKAYDKLKILVKTGNGDLSRLERLESKYD
ncbi:anthranilate phosphoribosyltransferase [miscellaneous Crenarchaeota group archaeon SMTZ1-55]|nr:MAG: anthranilate phosphoribosyltransferase [miscellaneous Crenarchaeota group archaeon SMTZ1-55]